MPSNFRQSSCRSVGMPFLPLTNTCHAGPEPRPRSLYTRQSLGVASRPGVSGIHGQFDRPARRSQRRTRRLDVIDEHHQIHLLQPLDGSRRHPHGISYVGPSLPSRGADLGRARSPPQGLNQDQSIGISTAFKSVSHPTSQDGGVVDPPGQTPGPSHSNRHKPHGKLPYPCIIQFMPKRGSHPQAQFAPHASPGGELGFEDHPTEHALIGPKADQSLPRPVHALATRAPARQIRLVWPGRVPAKRAIDGCVIGLPRGLREPRRHVFHAKPEPLALELCP